MTPKVVIVGGTGFLGKNLTRACLDAGYEVSVVSRSVPRTQQGVVHIPWGETWVEALNDSLAVINLVGQSVDCIKTPDNCDQILRSRVQSVQMLGAALRKTARPPSVWVQMSTAHIYGDPPEERCVEDSPFGCGFAPFIGQQWEAAYAAAVLPEMRQVLLRTSFVLGRDGGALSRLSFLAKLGLGGTIGHGRQGVSWLHEDDMNSVFMEAIHNKKFSGAYIASAPEPVSHAVFMRALRKSLGIRIGLPAMVWMVKIAAPLFMRTDYELAVFGRHCIPQRLLSNGFPFAFPDIDKAFEDIYET